MEEQRNYDYENENDDQYNEDEDYSRTLTSAKQQRKDIELEAQAIANRISHMELQENKVLCKIDETKRKAMEIMQVKKGKRDHNELMLNRDKDKTVMFEDRKYQVEEMKNDMKDGVEYARAQGFEESVTKANEVKSNLNRLRGQYTQQKHDQQISNVKNVNDIRYFEKNLERKKIEHEEQIKAEANRRYEDAINNEEEMREVLLKQMQILEEKELELMERLKQTNKIHDDAIVDMERIHNNEEPINILKDTHAQFKKTGTGYNKFKKPTTSNSKKRDSKMAPFRH